MSDLRKHLQSERLHRVEQAWQYISPTQQMWLFVRAMWWSLPTAIQLIERVQVRVEVWVLELIYQAHWV